MRGRQSDVLAVLLYTWQRRAGCKLLHLLNHLYHHRGTTTEDKSMAEVRQLYLPALLRGRIPQAIGWLKTPDVGSSSPIWPLPNDVAH